MKIYDHLKTNMKNEWKEKDTEEQFIYKTRKKGFGPFKLELWHLPADIRNSICAELEHQFAFLFDKLKVNGTRAVLDKYIKPVDVPLKMPAALKKVRKSVNMKAAVLEKITNVRENPQPLSFVDVPEPVPGKGQILVRVSACGVCHTELDEIEGRTPPSSFPFILGHQIVGVVAKRWARRR